MAQEVGILYFGRWYKFADDAEHEAAHVALKNIAKYGNGALIRARLGAAATDPVDLYVTAGADVVVTAR